MAEGWPNDLVPQRGMFSATHESLCKGKDWAEDPPVLLKREGMALKRSDGAQTRGSDCMQTGMLDFFGN